MVRTIACLPALTGAWRDRGGGMLCPTAWASYRRSTTPRSQGPQPATRARQHDPLGHALTELDPPVHALVVYNSNPARPRPTTRVLRGLAREDLFTVVLEHFLTDTADYADFVLPATTQLEHLDLSPLGPHVLTSTSRRSRRVGEALPNTEIFRRLARAWASTTRRSRPPTRSCAAAIAGARLRWTIAFERLREGDGPSRHARDCRSRGGFRTPPGAAAWSDGPPAGFDPPPGDDDRWR